MAEPATSIASSAAFDDYEESRDAKEEIESRYSDGNEDDQRVSDSGQHLGDC